MSINAKYLVETGLVVAGIFGGICRFLPSRPKKCRCYCRNLIGVTGPILIKIARDVATILPLNIFETELPYSCPLWNASLPNENHFANFVQNWLPWQRPLRNRKKRSRSIDRLQTNAYQLAK